MTKCDPQNDVVGQKNVVFNPENRVFYIKKEISFTQNIASFDPENNIS